MLMLTLFSFDIIRFLTLFTMTFSFQMPPASEFKAIILRQMLSLRSFVNKTALIILIASIILGVNQISLAFELLPYIYIDYHHFIKLAYCQAHCQAQYGERASRRLSDGTRQIFLNTNERQTACAMGCTRARHLNPIQNANSGLERQRLINAAFVEGQKYWLQSQLRSEEKLLNFSIEPEAEKVQVLCVQSNEVNAGIFQQFEALISIKLSNEHSDAIAELARLFVVRWRHKRILSQKQDSDAASDESDWITASIESDTIFKVEGIQMGFNYQFAITIIFASNETKGLQLFSQWINFSDFLDPNTVLKNMELKFYSRYNREDNVGVLVQWTRKREMDFSKTSKNETHVNKIVFRRELQSTHQPEIPKKLFINSKISHPNGSSSTSTNVSTHMEQTASSSILPFCRVQVEVSNSSDKIAHTIEIDNLNGIVIGNLSFNSEYSVKIQQFPLSTTEIVNSVSKRKNSTTLNGTFTSMHCWQIYGVGSLECDPEPVEDLEFRIESENKFATVRWNTNKSNSAIVRNTLLYEVNYHGKSNSSGCPSIKNTTKIIRPPTNSIIIPLPIFTVSSCDLVLTLTNYDLLGKQASVTRSFSLIHEQKNDEIQKNSSQSTVISNLLNAIEEEPSLLALVAVLILIPITAALAFFCTVKQMRPKQLKMKANNIKHKQKGKKIMMGLCGDSSVVVSLTTDNSSISNERLHQNVDKSTNSNKNENNRYADVKFTSRSNLYV